jgi:hypothetical protein
MQALFLFLIVLAFPFSGVRAEVVLKVDFDNRETGTYTREMVDSDWNNVAWAQGVDEGRFSIVEGDNAFENRTLAVYYPQGQYGPGDGGGQWLVLFDGHEELYLTYHLRFMPGFDPVLGGKLPGLVSSNIPSGGNPPDGDGGFTARYMWRSELRLVVYLYHLDQSGIYGDDLELNCEIEAGNWYQLTQRVRMNTPGANDGQLQVWVDGEEVLYRGDIRYRNSESISINAMYFSTFYGGNDSDWAPPKDEYIYMDDFLIYSDPEDTTEIAGILPKYYMVFPQPSATVLDFNENRRYTYFDLRGRLFGSTCNRRYSIRLLKPSLFPLHGP